MQHGATMKIGGDVVRGGASVESGNDSLKNSVFSRECVGLTNIVKH